jgi:hypothetical protein
LDREGTEADGDHAACDEAAQALKEMARGMMPGSNCRELAIHVRDSVGRPVARTTLAMKIERLR